MKRWNWWLAYQVLRGRIVQISYERAHDGHVIAVHLVNPDPKRAQALRPQGRF